MTLDTGLVSYYKCDEASGNAADSVGSNTLTNVGTVTYSAGKINNGANFTSGKYLTINSNTSLQLVGDMTISCWAYYTSGGSGGPMVTKSNGSASNVNYEFEFVWQSLNSGTNQLDWASSNTSNFYLNHSTTIPTLSANTWYHMVAVRSSGNITFYVNGTSYAGTGWHGASSNIGASTIPFQVGQRYDNYNFPGSLDEVGIWSRAITSAEVTQLYNGGAGLPLSQFSPVNSNFLMFM